MRGLMHGLDRGWRIFGTGLSFAVFGVGTILITVTLFPLIRLGSRDIDTRRRRFQHSYHRGCRFFIHFMRALGLITWEVHGVEHLRGRGRLVLANHPSLIDALFFLAWVPEAVCIVKQALWHNPFLGWAVRVAGYIGNASPDGLIEDCVASLRDGHTLIMFPEGTRSVPGRTPVFKRGAARIALVAGVAVVPVRIRCEPIMLIKGMPWYRVPQRPAHYTFRIGAALPAAHFAARPDESVAQAARRLTRQLESWLLPSPDGRPQGSSLEVPAVAGTHHE